MQLCCPRFALRKRPFSDGNQAPDCRRIVYCLHRWRAGNTAILRVDRHLQRVVVSAHLSLQACVAFPNHGNTHLPRRATGPLWRPPSGHFFPSLRLNYPSRSGYIRVVVLFWFPSNSVFSPALLAARALRRADPLSFPQVLGHAGRTCLHLTLPAVTRSPQVVRHVARLPCLGFPGGQKVAAVFSNLAAAIQ